METNEKNDQARNEQVGGMAGLGAGMMAGARVGTMLIPIPVVGSFVGAMFGGLFGSEVGKRVGPALINAGTAFVQTITTQSQAAKPETTNDKPDDVTLV